MSRTTRNIPKVTISAGDSPYAVEVRRTFKGGMLMSPAASGVWDDMRPGWGSKRMTPNQQRGRDEQRRIARRREQRRWEAEVAADLAPDPEPRPEPSMPEQPAWVVSPDRGDYATHRPCEGAGCVGCDYDGIVPA